MKLMQVSPSILSADFTVLGQECSKVLAAGAEMLHFDVMDGAFVPNISFGLPVLKSLSSKIQAIYDVHLMIQNPEKYFDAFAKNGANIITFHYEAVNDPLKAIKQIKALGCKAGVSIKPSTSARVLYPLLSQMDLALVMSVEPGFGGQSFNSEAVAKIKQMKTELFAQKLNTQIEVDGGIDNNTAKLCAMAGADILVAGSYIFGANSYETAINLLKNL